MKNLAILIGVIVIIGAIAGYFFMDKPEVPTGSVAIGSASHYTQFSGEIATTTLIQTGVTTLGNVTITEAFTGTIVFLDATSTTAYSTTNGTQIADFKTASVEGTYTFDVYALAGLVMVSADGFAFAGDMTVSWR